MKITHIRVLSSGKPYTRQSNTLQSNTPPVIKEKLPQGDLVKVGTPDNNRPVIKNCGNAESAIECGEFVW